MNFLGQNMDYFNQFNSNFQTFNQVAYGGGSK